jgi:hypothetical protein
MTLVDVEVEVRDVELSTDTPEEVGVEEPPEYAVVAVMAGEYVELSGVEREVELKMEEDKVLVSEAVESTLGVEAEVQ